MKILGYNKKIAEIKHIQKVISATIFNHLSTLGQIVGITKKLDEVAVKMKRTFTKSSA